MSRRRGTAADAWVVVDLDGTIVDVRPRHYATHLLVTTELDLPPLDPTAYWRIKRARRRLPAPYIAEGSSYERSFIEHIEDSALLELDRPLRGAVVWLAAARDAGLRMLVATGRQHRSRAASQLDSLGVPIDRLVTTSGSKSAAVADAISGRIVMWIGDTEIDIEAAHELGVRAVAVTSGIRSGGVLARYAPDLILPRIDHIPLPDRTAATATRPDAA